MGFHYGRFSPHKLIPSKSADNEIQTQTERPCFLIPSIPSCMLCIIYTTHKAYPSINMLKQKKKHSWNKTFTESMLLQLH